MYTDGGIYLGLSDDTRVSMDLRMANRHGLIAGATGTGKTITMKVLAESFSDAGVPVFLCDIKGDVSALRSRARRMRAWKSASTSLAFGRTFAIAPIL